MPDQAEAARILIVAERGIRPDRVAQREREEVLPAVHTADWDGTWRCECGAVHRVAESADLVLLAGADLADVECHSNACTVAIVPAGAESCTAPARFRRTVVRARLGLPPMPCPELLDRLAQPRGYRCEVACGHGAPPALVRRFASSRSAKSVPTSIRWVQIAVRFGGIVIPGGGASLVTLLYEE